MPAASVVICTYNRLDLLRLVLAGFARQSVGDFEVVVSDDGSAAELGEYVRALAASYPVALRHYWQADAGYRKSRAFNIGAAQARSDYIIGCDSDTVPHRRFVETHLRLREPQRFLVGRFAVLSERATGLLTEARIAAGWLEGWNWTLLADSAFGRTRRYVEHGFLLPDGLARAVHRRRPSLNLLGAHFSLWRDDFIRVNGFDEAFPCYGAEDLDLGYRLHNAGLRPKSAISQAVCYHLYPPPRTLSGDSNMSLARRSLESGAVACETGVAQWLPVSSPGAEAR